MKAISVKEPWATRILNGEKTIETRTWSTDYRGPLALHCSRHPSSPLSGKVFAVVNLYDIAKMIKEHEAAAMCEVYEKAKSWFIKDIVKIDPFDFKGQLRLFDVPVCRNCFKRVKENDEHYIGMDWRTKKRSYSCESACAKQ